MARKEWVFNLEGQQHSLSFEEGWSGRKKISIDGQPAYESGVMDVSREFPFEVNGHSVVLLVKPGLIDSFDLMVDDRSLKTGKIGPPRIKVEQTADGVTLVYNGGQGVFGIFLAFCLVVTVISVTSLFSMLSDGLTLADGLYILLLFPVIGLCLMYYSLVKMLNKTSLIMDAAGISVRQGPIPWFGNRVLQTADVENLYCESYERRSTSGEGVVTVTMKFKLYRLCAHLKDGRNFILLSGLDQCYEALFVNRQLGSRFGKLVTPGLMNS